ncbi:hypothetical protein WI91_02360 [Burkholderia vietnamiensis]|uniref:hypothetical protein n=1 Tax=Burkholderia vietnamiensis TaxID=60552 RepID=UPI000754B7AF|nr:hypothetical protein [Burkholderia vietnamiensis]KVD99657.1 hypothetical protein WI91_02360 [Burkholderia vietnamiensis]
MAKTLKPAATVDAIADRNTEAAELAATLPADRAGLLAAALSAISAMHAAVLEANAKAAGTAADRYEAVVWKLNGGTFRGSRDPANPDAAGHLVEQHCSAAPGTVPMWGQRGEFLITVSGVRAVVEVRDGFGRYRVGFAFRVVDADKPFISETGYKSHFETFKSGRTVEQVAIAVFSARLAEGRRMLAAEYRERFAAEPCRLWLAPAPATPAALEYEEPDGQLAFDF